MNRIVSGLITWLINVPVLLLAMHEAHLANEEYRADPPAFHPHSLYALGSWALVLILAVLGAALICIGIYEIFERRLRKSSSGKGSYYGIHGHSFGAPHDTGCNGGDAGPGGMV
ncbi:hypothetical protein [Kribbella sp. NBC_00359]|uniref:hypothetical protein n=1 Tax=Kribbella sp. NBC_00359 TaxID=2975966 RepID=UPI002E23F2AF